MQNPLFPNVNTNLYTPLQKSPYPYTTHHDLTHTPLYQPYSAHNTMGHGVRSPFTTYLLN